MQVSLGAGRSVAVTTTENNGFLDQDCGRFWARFVPKVKPTGLGWLRGERRGVKDDYKHLM